MQNYRAVLQKEQCGKARGGAVMRTHDGYDAQDSYQQVEDAMGENVHNGNDDIESNGRIFQGTPSEVAATMRSLVKAQEEHHQLNAVILQSLTDLQKKIDSG